MDPQEQILDFLRHRDGNANDIADGLRFGMCGRIRIYSDLDALQAKGLIESYRVPGGPERAGLPRTMYRLRRTPI